MSRDPTTDLIDRLATELPPVEPIPPLRLTFASLLGACLVLGALVLAVYQPKPGLWQSVVGDPIWSGVLLGLCLAIGGGLVASAASVVPGREGIVRGSLGTGAAGLALAVGVAVVGTPWAEGGIGGVSAADGVCILRAMAFALLPAVAILWAASRGWSGRPALTALAALAAAGAVGALLVHLTCPAVDPAHLLCTHVPTPLLLAGVLTGLLAPVVRRWAR